MPSETHNTKAGPDQKARGGGDNTRQQQASGETRPDGGGRDREGRKGGSNEKNL